MSKKLHPKRIKLMRQDKYVEVDPQVLRWRALRKKLGLYKPARTPKTPSQTSAKGSPLNSDTVVSTGVAKIDLWDLLK